MLWIQNAITHWVIGYNFPDISLSFLWSFSKLEKLRKVSDPSLKIFYRKCQITTEEIHILSDLNWYLFLSQPRGGREMCT